MEDRLIQGSFRFSPAEREALARESERTLYTQSQIIRLALRRYLGIDEREEVKCVA